MDRIKLVVENKDVIITSFPENLISTNSLRGLLMGKITERYRPISRPSRGHKVFLIYICHLVNAEAQVTDLRFRIVILQHATCNVILNEEDIFFIPNPQVLRTRCIPIMLSFVAFSTDLTLVKPLKTLYEQCSQNQEESLPSGSNQQRIIQEPNRSLNEQHSQNQDESLLSRSITREARRRIIWRHRNDRYLRSIISLNDLSSFTSPVFYCWGKFTNGSIIDILSDEVCLGYCRVCDENYCYSEFMWATVEDKCYPSSELPYCPTCDADESILTPLMVYFDCFMKFEVDGSDAIEVLFHYRSGNNFLGVTPMDYARNDTDRGTFRFKASNLLQGSTKIGFNFILVGEVHIAILLSVEPIVESETTNQLTNYT